MDYQESWKHKYEYKFNKNTCSRSYHSSCRRNDQLNKDNKSQYAFTNFSLSFETSIPVVGQASTGELARVPNFIEARLLGLSSNGVAKLSI